MSIIDPTTLAKFYQCTENAPLGCRKPSETTEKISGAKFCLECGFPTTLPVSTELRGNLGTYRIDKLLRSQGIGRLYRGIQTSSGQSVVIKEYLLPKQCFNTAEAQQRRTALSLITQGNLTTPKSREFRLVTPSDTIADPSSDRVYLIFPGEIAALPTLKQVLAERTFSASRVRQVLDRILQSLHFLHTQPSRLAADTGTAHGNLGLDSLLVGDNGYVYLCDLTFWEQLFVPASPQTLLPQQDLIDLGAVAFALWTNQPFDSNSEALLNSREAQHWPQEDPPLKNFLLRLLGLETPFSSAAQARQALVQLSQPETDAKFHGNPNSGSSTKQKSRYWLLSLLALPLLGGLLWFLLPRFISSNSDTQTTASFNQLVPSFADVNGIQPGQYPYTGEVLGTWTTVLGKKPVSDRQAKEFLTQPKLDTAAIFNYRTDAPQGFSFNEVLNANARANFAIASSSTQLPEGLIPEKIAYDGLLVYVPVYKTKNLPRTLQGKISLAQLQQIFTGQITNWKQLGANFPDLPLKPYLPKEPEALRLFQQKVIGNDPSLIAQFNQIEQRSTFDTLRSVAAGEKQAQKSEAGSISFGLLTKTWDQCKVYPLAIAPESADPVQPLLKETTNGVMQPISPTDNLCFEKPNIKPNLSAFQTATYPLSTPLIIAYPRDNNLPGNVSGPLFADFLKTQDGQYLLQQTGLVPLQAVPENYTLSPSTNR